MIELTVAIPTFNRNIHLLNTVGQLLPQLTSECSLLILDNHSTTSAEETLCPILSNYPHVNCTFIRHSWNIGGNANILRCFELCETSWLWMLGDDDKVQPQAVSTILQILSEDPELTYVNFASEIYERPLGFVTTGLEEFATKLDNFGNVMFISASLYNCRKVRQHLALASHYSYSCAAHVLMVILSLQEGDRCLFSNLKIVRWENPPMERAYSFVLVSIGRPTLLEIPLPPAVRVALAQAIRSTTYSLRAFAWELYNRGSDTGDFQTSRYLYDQMTYRLYYFDRGIITRLKIWVCRLPLKFPQGFQLLNRLSIKLDARRSNPSSHAGRTEP